MSVMHMWKIAIRQFLFVLTGIKGNVSLINFRTGMNGASHIFITLKNIFVQWKMLKYRGKEYSCGVENQKKGTS